MFEFVWSSTEESRSSVASREDFSSEIMVERDASVPSARPFSVLIASVMLALRSAMVVEMVSASSEDSMD